LAVPLADKSILSPPELIIRPTAVAVIDGDPDILELVRVHVIKAGTKAKELADAKGD
jgi:hypothetical protein